MYKGSSQTCYKLELRNRILKAAMTEFLHKGVKSVKMDDIANTLAISKRTLYEIYSNKEELLLEVCAYTSRSSTTTCCNTAWTRTIM